MWMDYSLLVVMIIRIHATPGQCFMHYHANNIAVIYTTRNLTHCACLSNSSENLLNILSPLGIRTCTHSLVHIINTQLGTRLWHIALKVPDCTTRRWERIAVQAWIAGSCVCKWMCAHCMDRKCSRTPWINVYRSYIALRSMLYKVLCYVIQR